MTRRTASMSALLGAFVLSSVTSCTRKPVDEKRSAPPSAAESHEQAAAAPKPDAGHHAAAQQVVGGLPGNSVYQLRADLLDQDARALKLDAFRGHPVLLSLFYSSCTSMCPLLITHLHAIEAALSPQARAQTHILLVSLDPARDTPPKLKALAQAHDIDTTRWSLTRTDDASVQELAAVLGVRYRRMPTGEIAHASVITLLRPDGTPVRRIEDSPDDPAPFIRDIERTAAASQSAPDTTKR